MPYTRSRFGVIFLTVFIDFAGFGIILPVIPYYAQEFGAGGFGYGALIGIFSLLQFSATMLLGRLSDRIGRRPVLLGTIFFAALGYLAFAAAQSYAVLFLARMVSGFAAGNISVAQAYMADITAPSERSRGMGLIGAAFGLGFIVGPALGGVAGHYGGPAGAGLAAAGLCLLNFFSAFLLLKESLHQEHRAKRALLDIEHIVQGLRDPLLGRLFAVFGLIPFAFSGFIVSFPLYAGAEFGWDEIELAKYFTLVGLVAASVQGYVFGKLSRRFGDRKLIVIGTIGMAVPMALTSFVPAAIWLYVLGFAIAFANSILSPGLMGMISTLASATEQGAMLGAAQALSSLGRLSGPFVFGELFDLASPTAAFLAAAGVMVVGWLILLRAPGKPDAVVPTGSSSPPSTRDP
ncbi:MAG: MFS transporter [Gemmatimonadota bacterium]|nr:MAG: MFS transporter [Gemmatimonadota bacterium]